MKIKALTILLVFIFAAEFSQTEKQKPSEKQTIRLSTQLVQPNGLLYDRTSLLRQSCNSPQNSLLPVLAVSPNLSRTRARPRKGGNHETTQDKRTVDYDLS
ncbi:MAG TPA: hypothetical protein VFB82_03645 [Blastocatellia bacterium]|nr:hypothetical protein [Blastocatellia bacterium]